MPWFLWLGGIHLDGICHRACAVFWQYRVVTVFRYSVFWQLVFSTESLVLNKYCDYSVLPKKPPKLKSDCMPCWSWRSKIISPWTERFHGIFNTIINLVLQNCYHLWKQTKLRFFIYIGNQRSTLIKLNTKSIISNPVPVSGLGFIFIKKNCWVLYVQCRLSNEFNLLIALVKKYTSFTDSYMHSNAGESVQVIGTCVHVATHNHTGLQIPFKQLWIQV